MLVQATHGKQLLVGTPFNDAAVVHHQHLIGMLDGRQAVRDDQRGAFGHQALQRILHQSLGFVVQRGSGFVEDQDRGVTQDRAGDRQALALAAGQQRAVLADRGLQLLRHARDELPRIGCFGRRTDLLLARFHAIGDVGRDGVIEQHDLLPDHRHLPTQVGQRIVIQRDAIEGDDTTAGLVEARHQPDQAGLATAGTTHDGGDRAGLGNETDVVQGNAAVLAVAQHDVVEGQFAAYALHAVAALVTLDLHVEDAEQALCGGHAARDRGLHAGQAAQRRNDGHHRGHQAHELAGVEAAGQRFAGRYPDDHRQRQCGQELHHAGGGSTGDFHLHVQRQHAVGQARVARDLMLLGAVHLHFLLRRQRLFGGLRHRTHTILDATADAAVALAHVGHDHADQRYHHQHRHGDLHAHLQHYRQHGDDGQGVGHHGLECVGTGLSDLFGIEVQAADHHRRRFGIKMRGRQVQVLGQHLFAQVAHHAATSLGQRVVAHPGGDAAHQEQAQDGQRQDHRHARFRVDETAVDQRLHQLGEVVARQGFDHHGDDRGHHEHPIGAGVPQQTFVDRPHRRVIGTHGRTSGAVAMAIRRKPS